MDLTLALIMSLASIALGVLVSFGQKLNSYEFCTLIGGAILTGHGLALMTKIVMGIL